VEVAPRLEQLEAMEVVGLLELQYYACNSQQQE
jgi:hypothetical protein